MADKSLQFDEQTKIRSAKELEEMLRQVAPKPAADDDPAKDEFEAHTQIGNVQHLIAKSAATEEVKPKPRASHHVIRRASSPVMAQVIRAEGTVNDAKPAPKTDDDAFGEWDGPEIIQSRSEPIAVVAPEAVESRSSKIALPLPAPDPSEELAVVQTPSELPTMKRRIPWGVAAWCALLVIMLGVATMSYMRISALEDELAMTKAKLDRATPARPANR